jgi:hypothetical protein
MLIILKSGSLNLLKPPGPVKACNGIALPFPKYLKICSVEAKRFYAEGLTERQI